MNCFKTNIIYLTAVYKHSISYLLGSDYWLCVIWGKTLLMWWFFHTHIVARAQHTHTAHTLFFISHDVKDVNTNLYTLFLPITSTLILRRTCKTTWCFTFGVPAWSSLSNTHTHAHKYASPHTLNNTNIIVSRAVFTFMPLQKNLETFYTLQNHHQLAFITLACKQMCVCVCVCVWV